MSSYLLAVLGDLGNLVGERQLGPQRKGKISPIGVDKPLALFPSAP